MIKENERPDHASLSGWQNSPNLESAETAAALIKYEVDHGFTSEASVYFQNNVANDGFGGLATAFAVLRDFVAATG